MMANPMTEHVEGFLEIGCNENGEIIINHPDLKPDANGVGHIVFSVRQAYALADSLVRQARIARQLIYEKGKSDGGE